MSHNLIFIDESESMQRAIATILHGNPEFNLALIKEPASIYKAAKNLKPDIIVLSYNTIDTELKKSITELKTSKDFQDTPLLLLVPSDLSDKERDVLIKLKTDGFIYRPFDKDTFILKVKKALSISDEDKSLKTSEDISENKTEAINSGKYSLEKNTIQNNKIFDITDFEIKKTDKNLDFQNIQDAAPLEKNNNNNNYNANDNQNNVVDIGNAELESAELSHAFENLFKDDAVFKEFQELNKKEGLLTPLEDSSTGETETLLKKTEDAAPLHAVETNYAENSTKTGEEKKESFISTSSTESENKVSESFPLEKLQDASAETLLQTTVSAEGEDKHAYDEIDKTKSNLWNIESADSSETNEPNPLNELMSSLNANLISENTGSNVNANILDINVPESGFEINSDEIQEPMKPAAQIKEEKPITNNRDFNEPFAGFNIALSEGKNSILEKEKSELKILNEQDLANLDSYIKSAIEKTMNEIKPEIIEAIKNMLPDIIEKLVKEEIEKIKQS